MVFTDFGLTMLGSFVAGFDPTSPGSTAFGIGSISFNAGSAHLEDEFLRKSTAWTFTTGTDPEGISILTTTDAVGSTIREFGLVQNATIGSDVVSRDRSGIGDKNNTFSAEIRFNFRPRRIVTTA